MSVMDSYCLTIDPARLDDGDQITLPLEDGTELIMVLRRDISDGASRLVLSPPKLPPDLVKRMEHVALTVLRRQSSYVYGRTRFTHAQVVDLGRELTGETCLIGPTSGLIHVQQGAWLSGTVDILLKDLPPRTHVVWRARSRVKLLNMPMPPRVGVMEFWR